ncbi:hypothetical protein BC937DRAFT_89285 [Endogone sp. FLAS-F59071]|nr:hypothetical protein BC937DRAFT_89285 [Endogone sp. FLAS-F59071]|eukprot:RUS17984.1 hypothetical protein BC937DRAFT_89285 [Endogone sp. FLAS-F59071]
MNEKKHHYVTASRYCHPLWLRTRSTTSMASIRHFSPKVLKSIAKPHPPRIFLPRVVVNEFTGKSRWHPPAISLRRQANMRKACLLEGVAPESIGMPPLPDKKPLRIKPPKLAKHERMAPERKAKIAKAIENMPETIKAWKEEKLREKTKSKSSLPF